MAEGETYVLMSRWVLEEFEEAARETVDALVAAVADRSITQGNRVQLRDVVLPRVRRNLELLQRQLAPGTTVEAAESGG